MGQVKSLLLNGAAALGLPRRIGPWLAPGRLAILMYHGVTREPLPVPDWCFVPAADFRAQMAYLARHCRVLPLLEAIAQLQRGEPLAGKPAVAITFDDGYHNNLSVALPILREFALPATIFLNTAFIGTREGLWFCRLHGALSTTQTPELEFEGARYRLATSAQRADASARLQGTLKMRPHADLLQATSQIMHRLGFDPAAPLPSDSPYQFMDASGVREALASGLITFGAHTRDHTILSRVSPEEQAAQIVGSLEDTTRLTGVPCALFAYPNGRQDDFTPESVSILRRAGVVVAVTTCEGSNGLDTDPLRLGRYGIGCGTPPALFQAQVHHLISRGHRA